MFEIKIFYPNIFGSSSTKPQTKEDYTEVAGVDRQDLQLKTDNFQNELERDAEILEKVFRHLNQTSGLLERGLRSFSVGDVVSINQRSYRCEATGWSLVDF